MWFRNARDEEECAEPGIILLVPPFPRRREGLGRGGGLEKCIHPHETQTTVTH